jgi:hypothetical protein
MPDFQPTSEVIYSFTYFPSISFDHNSLLFFCRTQCLPLKPGPSPTTFLAQFLLWGSTPQLWPS